VEEVSALHRDKEALGRLNKEYSDLSLDYRNLEKSLNDYKITHPDAITEEACKKLESRFQQAREESQRSVDNYKETHPEEITSEKFYTLGRQFFAAETKLKNAEQVFSRYKATHPHTEDQYNALRATNTELATKIDEAKKQQTDPGSSGGDGNPAGLIIVVAIFVAIIAFITGGKK
jgi:phage shock protein A